MGKIYASGGGGGADGSDDCTATKAEVRKGYTAVVNGSDDEVVEGTMPDNGAVTQNLNCGGKYTVPAGYHNGSGVIAANSLASQTDATATAGYIYSGKTAWVKGTKITGTMTVSSVTSFSVAAYSTSQVIAKWTNPGNGHPFSGVIICAKTGGYPSNINDGRVYTGIGSNSSAGGVSSVTIGSLSAGTTYYFRIWAYATCSAGNIYSGYQQTTCAPTAHGRQAFTSSGTFTVPANVRSINIHCTGGGGGGDYGDSGNSVYYDGGSGGAGGCTAYKNGIAVSPGTQIAVVVGTGGAYGYYNNASGNAHGKDGGTSSASMNGTLLVSASGGEGAYYYASGGSGGGAYGSVNSMIYPGKGGSNGTNGYVSSKQGSTYAYSAKSKGQGSTTREFGTGTLYGGGGGGGGGETYDDDDGTYLVGASGGDGGGGNGGGYSNRSLYAATSGTSGSGGGGGGGACANSNKRNGASGGSGNVIITW